MSITRNVLLGEIFWTFVESVTMIDVAIIN